MPDGKRVRQNFKGHAEAVTCKAESEIQALNQTLGAGFKQTRLTDERLAQAEAAFLKLGDQPLMTAVDYYLTHRPQEMFEITVENAVQKFLTAKQTPKKLRPRTWQDYQSRTAPLVKSHQARTVSSISRTELESLIFKPGQAACTANGNRRVLHAFFAWCVDQEYCQVNPVSKIVTAERDDKEPEIMTLAEVKLLLGAALTVKKAAMLPYAVLGLFMGLRPEEIARLQWKHVDLEQKLVRIQGDVAKLRHRRVIEMPGDTVEWMRACYGKPIIPKNMRRDWDAVRRMAGFKPSYLKKSDKNLKNWPQDVIRHTALSCHYAFGKDEAATAQWAGNSPETLIRYYKGLVNPQEAQEFWELKPTGQHAQIIPVPVAA
jgi:integrase